MSRKSQPRASTTSSARSTLSRRAARTGGSRDQAPTCASARWAKVNERFAIGLGSAWRARRYLRPFLSSLEDGGEDAGAGSKDQEPIGEALIVEHHLRRPAGGGPRRRHPRRWAARRGRRRERAGLRVPQHRLLEREQLRRFLHRDLTVSEAAEQVDVPAARAHGLRRARGRRRHAGRRIV